MQSGSVLGSAFLLKDARILAYREILVKFQWAGAMALETQFLSIIHHIKA